MYISVDIETTGLDPDRHQILEIGAVAWVDDRCISMQPTFNRYIRPEGDIVGSPYALAMNMRLLEKLKSGGGISIQGALKSFRDWCSELGASNANKATLVGKNFGSFDLQFLRRHVDWPSHLFTYRNLEVGSLYATREGIPKLEDCIGEEEMRHFGNVFPGEPHEAVYDAAMALEAVRQKL